jgi:hypothetical protein
MAAPLPRSRHRYTPALATGQWTDFWVYVAGPVLGASLARDSGFQDRGVGPEIPLVERSAVTGGKPGGKKRRSSLRHLFLRSLQKERIEEVARAFELACRRTRGSFGSLSATRLRSADSWPGMTCEPPGWARRANLYAPSPQSTTRPAHAGARSPLHRRPPSWASPSTQMRS